MARVSASMPPGTAPWTPGHSPTWPATNTKPLASTTCENGYGARLDTGQVRDGLRHGIVSSPVGAHADGLPDRVAPPPDGSLQPTVGGPQRSLAPPREVVARAAPRTGAPARPRRRDPCASRAGAVRRSRPGRAAVPVAGSRQSHFRSLPSGRSPAARRGTRPCTSSGVAGSAPTVRHEEPAELDRDRRRHRHLPVDERRPARPPGARRWPA